MKAKQLTLLVLSVAIGVAAMLGGCRPSTPTTIPPTATPEVPTPTTIPPTATPEPPTPTAVVPTETATPTPTAAKPANVALVTADALNVRRGPGTLYSVITVVRRGTSLTVLGQDPSGSWLNVRLPDGTEGWVSRAFTDFVGAAPLVPTPPPPPTPTPTPTAIPTATPTATTTPTPTPTPAPEGWRGEYYDNISLMGAPVLVRDDTTIKFNWGSVAPAAGLPTDDFSVRWTRKLSFPVGIYRFSVRSDDGVRVWLDGILIIDQWHDAAGVTYTAEQTLAAGMHTLRIEYYERRGVAQIEFWWERTGDFPQWRGAYFPNVDLVGDPTLVRNDTAIDFNWGAAAPAAGLPADNFSARWTRTAQFDAATYRFHVVVDDGACLYVDDVLVIDEWRDGGRREVTADRTLGAGNHSLRVEYYERTGEALIRVWWEKITSYPDWKGEYWSNRQLRGDPVLVRNDVKIDFNWGTGAPAVGIPADNFSARWSRTVTFESGVYRFYAWADDGIRLYVDDDLVLDEWHDSAGDEVYKVKLTLSGKHRLVVEYYERTEAALVKFWWE